LKSIDILIVDDHPLMLKALRDLLGNEAVFNIIGTSSSGAEGERLYRELKPDIVIMDVYMKPLNGIETAKNILKNDPEAKIIGLSNFHSAEDANEMQKIGAKGYMIKIASLQSIIENIKKVYAGALCFEPKAEF
jgi:DNA-binding NarL/FixJ family response regulator